MVTVTARLGRAAGPEGQDDASATISTRTLVLALAGLLLFRLAALYFNRTDLFFDEAQYWSWSLEPAFGYYSKPPLIAWLIGATTAVCGHGEACIRAASPLLHTLTAAFVCLAGRTLYDSRTGLWSALAFATLPGVSFSSGIISTDVPLLTCWAGALAAFAHLLRDERRGWLPAVALGLAIGLGLNAKYAMAYFVVCVALFLITTPARRDLLRDVRLYVALAIAIACIAPNVVWNAQNAFATIGHTADNANWGRSLFHPAKMAEFFGAQFGVFGPVFFAALLAIAWQARRSAAHEADRLLLWLSLPIIAVITVQALLSRAHANWAATAYVAATILVVAQLLGRTDGWRWLRVSLVLHVIVAGVLAAGLATAGAWRLPVKTDPAARLLGWKDLGAGLTRVLSEARGRQQPYRAVLTDERLLTATLIYYLRGDETPVRAWKVSGAKPRDHYELTRPYAPAADERVLLVSQNPAGGGILERFGRVERLAPLTVATGKGGTRTLHLFALSAAKGG